MPMYVVYDDAPCGLPIDFSEEGNEGAVIEMVKEKGPHDDVEFPLPKIVTKNIDCLEGYLRVSSAIFSGNGNDMRICINACKLQW